MNEPSLRQAILDDPDDDTPRLVYADWLTDHGDDRDRLRAEFIRAQVRLAAATPDHPDYIDLVEAEEEARRLFDPREQRPELPQGMGFHNSAELGVESYERGFPFLVQVNEGSPLRQKLGELVAKTTVRGLGVCAVTPPRLPVLLAAPALAHCRRLTISAANQNGLTDDELARAVAGAPALANLRRLDLLAAPTGVGMDALARGQHFARLERLYLSPRQAESASVHNLARAGWFQGLRRLGLYLLGRSDLLGALLREVHLPRLHTLDLKEAHFDTVRPLVEAARGLPALAALVVSRNPGLRGAAAAELSLVRFPRLAVLGMAGCRLGARGATLLARGEILAGVRALDLSGNAIGDQGVKALARAPRLEGLRRLFLGGNTFEREGLLALAGSGPLRSLTTLDLGCIEKPAADARVMAEFLERLDLPDLRHLDLDAWPVGDAGAKALAGNPNLGNLTRLSLHRTDLGAAGVRALLNSPHLRRLRDLDLTSSVLSWQAAEALLDRDGLPGLARCDLEWVSLPADLAARLRKARPGVFRGLR